MATRNDPARSFNFLLSFDNMQGSVGFSECSGLSTDADIAEYREGADKSLSTRKLTGLQKHAHITLKRGVTKNLDLWTWRKNIIEGTQDRRSGTITLLDELQQPVLHWKITAAWPVKYEGPGLNAKGNDVAIETLELVHEGLDLESA
ncbi:MAG TPA: phage tail protein [Candidatus Binatia bacterium]|nr:phage tail protein [Candidatus Binatia bacterium]